jgi:formiminotetrahydrofolate cyclodeaminase
MTSTGWPAMDDALARVAAGGPGAGAGAAASAAAALAAAIVEIVARASDATWPEARAVAAQGAALRIRAVRLAADNAEVFAAAQAALGEAREATTGRGLLGPALDRAAAVPLAVADVAADVAALAEHAGRHGHPDRRPDAAAAAELAAGAAAAAAHLVAVNLVSHGEGGRVAAAHAAAANARAAADRTIALGG